MHPIDDPDSPHASPAQWRRLVRSLQCAQEAERTRVAQHLHDELLQTLGALKLGLGPLESTSGAPLSVWADVAERTAELADYAVAATRQLMGELRPSMLSDLGLGTTLEATLRQFSTLTGAQTRVEILGPAEADLDLPPATATCLFRVVQAVLLMANGWVEGSAQQTTIQVTLDLSAPGRAGLEISVGGAVVGGLDLTVAESPGLLGVAERLRAQGGSLEILRRAADDVTFTARLRRRAGDIEW